MAGNAQRRDSKRRVLRRGESIRADGKYQFKYHVNGVPPFCLQLAAGAHRQTACGKETVPFAERT